ncbi:MAG: hypothetical protein K2F79_01145, partial [Muribaculaceae bacterium]|nr:hypothetical protein [Muribaculaceae bacterium]
LYKYYNFCEKKFIFRFSALLHSPLADHSRQPRVARHGKTELDFCPKKRIFALSKPLRRLKPRTGLRLRFRSSEEAAAEALLINTLITPQEII